MRVSGPAVFDTVTGAFQGYRGTGTDITAEIEAEERRGVLEAQLQHAQRIEALGTLAGGLAHDINNTLVPIVSLSAVAIEDLPEDSPTREDLEIVQSAALRARDLVQRILAFSRRHGVEMRPVAFGEGVRDAFRLLRPTIPSTIGIEFRADCQDEVMGDPGPLNPVVVNLVNNAAPTGKTYCREGVVQFMQTVGGWWVIKQKKKKH